MGHRSEILQRSTIDRRPFRHLQLTVKHLGVFNILRTIQWSSLHICSSNGIQLIEDPVYDPPGVFNKTENRHNNLRGFSIDRRAARCRLLREDNHRGILLTKYPIDVYHKQKASKGLQLVDLPGGSSLYRCSSNGNQLIEDPVYGHPGVFNRNKTENRHNNIGGFWRAPFILQI